MRLEDVSDSRRRRPLGKLIFQAKLFLFWWSTGVERCLFFLNKAPPLRLRSGEGRILQVNVGGPRFDIN